RCDIGKGMSMLSHDEAAFWSACARGELAFRCCESCGNWHHPPLPLCPFCQKSSLTWVRAEGPCLLYSWTRAHIAAHSSVAEDIPYYIVVVEFPACGGVRLLGRLERPASEPPRIGSVCELHWIKAAGQSVPAFRISN